MHEDWMARLGSAIKSRRLIELTLPGAHNAAVNDTTSWNPLLACQSCTVKEQLRRGIRFFDLRFTPSGKGFQAYHKPSKDSLVGSADGHWLHEILKWVKSFTESFPKEIIILNFSNFMEMGKDHLSRFARAIGDKLGDYCASQPQAAGDLAGMTVEDLWNKKQRIIVVFSKAGAEYYGTKAADVEEVQKQYKWLWSADYFNDMFPDAADVDSLKSKVEENVTTRRKDGVFNILQCQMTPTTKSLVTAAAATAVVGIATGVGVSIVSMAPVVATSVISMLTGHVTSALAGAAMAAGAGSQMTALSLKLMALQSNSAIIGGLRMWTGDGRQHVGNILMFDYFEYGEVVESAVRFNSGVWPLELNGGTSADPCLAASSQSLIAVWKGWDADSAVYCASMDKSGAWTKQTAIPDAATTDGPSVAFFNGRFCAAWRANSGDNAIWATSRDGEVWQRPPKKVGGASTTEKPVLAAFGDSLYVAWKGADSDGKVYTASAGKNGVWGPPRCIPNAETGNGPALAFFNGRLYAAWRGVGRDGRIWLASMDGKGSWTQPAELPEVGTTMGPALAVLDAYLYAVWKGYDDNFIWYSRMKKDGVWEGQRRFPCVSTAHSPTVAVFEKTIYVAWQGEEADGNVYYDRLIGAASEG